MRARIDYTNRNCMELRAGDEVLEQCAVGGAGGKEFTVAFEYTTAVTSTSSLVRVRPQSSILHRNAFVAAAKYNWIKTKNWRLWVYWRHYPTRQVLTVSPHQ